jgi:hypothetical protein
VNPFPTRRGWLKLYLAAWLPLALLVAALLAFAGLPPAEALAVGLPLVLLFSQIGLSAGYLCRALPLRFDRRAEWAAALRPVAVLGAAAALSSALWVLFGRGWAAVLALAPPYDGVTERYREATPLVFGLGVLLYLLAAAGHYLALALDESRAAERRALELAMLAREAELRALRAQVDPHFLFNSLNAVAALTGADPAGARRMALMLADFLRRTLRLAERPAIPLAEEVALARAYLAIEQVRFGDRLAVEARIDEGIGELAVPPLLLQPLVENAVKHGVAELVAGGRVSIAARRAGDGATIEIANDRDPEAPAAAGARTAPGAAAGGGRPGGAAGGGEGIGLANVRRRLEARYGRDARLEIAAEPERFRVVVHLPGPAG